MRFLHTSDWHIGRTVRSHSRASEQEAALQQVLDHAREQQVDAMLVAGDVFDTSAPSPESEAMVYGFFRELHGAGIPAIVIAGNHDHPKRLDAVAPLLTSMRIHALGVPRGATDGAILQIESRDDKETAVVAALPWVNERDFIDFERMQGDAGAPILQYAERLQSALARLAEEFRPDACSVLVSHLLADDAIVGSGGGERELHMAMGLYGVRREALPAAAQYIALGHVHKPQDIRCQSRAAYSGSLLQLDFGERDQEKFVNLVEVHPRLPAQVTQLPITAGKPMIDLGSPEHGIALNDIVQHRDEDAWHRVFVEVDLPVANLAQIVREQLPSAVHVERARHAAETAQSQESHAHLGPVELFGKFYESKLGRSSEASPETLALFRRLLEEETHAFGI